MDAVRQQVLRDQAAVVKRALAAGTEQAQRDVRRNRALILLMLLLVGAFLLFFSGGLSDRTLRSTESISTTQGALRALPQSNRTETLKVG